MVMPITFSGSKGSKTLRWIRSLKAFTRGVLPSQKQRKTPVNLNVKTSKGRYKLLVATRLKWLTYFQTMLPLAQYQLRISLSYSLDREV